MPPWWVRVSSQRRHGEVKNAVKEVGDEGSRSQTKKWRFRSSYSWVEGGAPERGLRQRLPRASRLLERRKKTEREERGAGVRQDVEVGAGLAGTCGPRWSACLSRAGFSRPACLSPHLKLRCLQTPTRQFFTGGPSRFVGPPASTCIPICWHVQVFVYWPWS